MKSWLALAAFLLPLAAHAACPPVPFVFANGSPFDANKANQDWEALRTCINSPVTGADVYPHVQTNAALLAASTATYPAGVWRDDYAAGFGAPPLFYFPSPSACPLASGNGDNGSQVRSANGFCWIAHFDAAGADLRQWGVQAGGADMTATVQAAVSATAAVMPLIVPGSGAGYSIGSSPILMPNGTSIRGGGPASYFRALPSTNGSLFRAVAGATVILLENFEVDGNSAAGATGNCIDTDSATGVVDFTALNLRVHDCGLAGLRLNGTATASAGFDVSGGEYYRNGRNATGNQSGAGVELGYSSFGRVRGAYLHHNSWAGVDALGSINHVVIEGNVFSTNGGADAPITGSCGAPIQDAITFYNANSNRVVVANNIIQDSCNNGIHGGGNYVTYTGNVVDSPVFLGIVHRTRKLYSAGTAACAGTTTITGSGTAWSSVLPYNGFYARGNGGEITIAGVTYNVLSVNSDTSITTTGATCPTISGAEYLLTGFVSSHDVTIANNVVSNSSLNAIWLDQVIDGAVTGNTSTVGGDGIFISASSSASVSGNTMRQKPNGIRIGAEVFSNVGTVTVTNGSANVTGAGTVFLQDVTPGAIFQVVGDTTNYVVQSVTSDTAMTLTGVFTGTGGAGKKYGAAIGPSTSTVISGNNLGFNTTGLSIQASNAATITGNALDHNTTAIDGQPTTGNVEFADFIHGNNFTGSTTKLSVETKNQRIGTNTDGVSILTGIAPVNCAGQLAGAIYNNAGTPAVCP